MLTDVWMDRWINRQAGGQTYEQTDGQTKVRLRDVRTDAYIGTYIDRWMNRLTGRWTDILFTTMVIVQNFGNISVGQIFEFVELIAVMLTSFLQLALPVRWYQ